MTTNLTQDETTDEAPALVFRLTPTNLFFRSHCDICGGETDKSGLLIEAALECDHSAQMCERCLEAGDVDARLEKHAAALEAEVEWLRSLRGRCVVPTWAEYRAAWDAKEEQWRLEHAEEIAERDREAGTSEDLPDWVTA